MTDQELRDQLASEYAHACAPASHEFHRTCELGFRAGWEMARANEDYADEGLKAGITLKAIADRKEELLSALKSAAVTLKEIQAQGVCSGSLKNLLDGTLEFSKKVIGDEE